MESLNYVFVFIAAVFIVATGWLVTQEKQPINVYSNQNMNEHFLNVNGDFEQDVTPDRAMVWLSIVTNASTAKEAQSKNRDVANRVFTSLENAGIQKADIETTGYNVEHLTFYNYEKNRNVDNGYQVRNSFKVTTKDMELVGSIIDAAAASGVNDVDNVGFDLTDEKTAEVRKTMLGKAAKSGRDKAEVIASAIGVTVGKVAEVSESFNYNPVMMNADYGMSKMAMMESRAPTPITPKNVHISASVSVKYLIA